MVQKIISNCLNKIKQRKKDKMQKLLAIHLIELSTEYWNDCETEIQNQ